MPSCPCCDQPLPSGLFAETASVKLPSVVAMMRQAGVSQEIISTSHMIVAGGRSFVLADASLPITEPSSPIRVRVWVEVDEGLVLAMSGAVAGGEPVTGPGSLACDWPAFPGSLGAQVTIEAAPGQQFPRVVACSDHRLRAVCGKLSHDHYAMIYRRLFGGPNVIADADLTLRAAVAARWREVAGQAAFTREITPPAGFAGMTPAKLIIAPPVDTGGRAFMATIGNAEALTQAGAELCAWAHDPGDGFINSFGEFCYWSRQTQAVPAAGRIIPEHRPIPDTDGMCAWLICEPWWTTLPAATYPGRHVELLAAVPIHRQELVFAAQVGSGELLSRLELYDVDVADLEREPCV